MNGEFVKIDLKMLVPAKSGGKVEGLISAGLKKEQLHGLMVGPAAKMRVKPGAIFYIRLADPANIEELSLLALVAKKDRRELEFVLEKKQKPAPKFEAIRPFEATEVAAKLYRISAPKLVKGEYLFLLSGTIDPQKGVPGKGYDFGVD
jgi:hypothetical protein